MSEADVPLPEEMDSELRCNGQTDSIGGGSQGRNADTVPDHPGIWMDARMVTLYKVELYKSLQHARRSDRTFRKRRKFMFRNYVFTFSVVSLLVMGADRDSVRRG